jgi:hypothetical protein
VSIKRIGKVPIFYFTETYKLKVVFHFIFRINMVFRVGYEELLK